MKKPIYVTMPTLAPLSEVNEYLNAIWESGVMTHNGPILQRFEKEVKEWHDAVYHTVVVNGTVALHPVKG